jgi:hypothetical protein
MFSVSKRDAERIAKKQKTETDTTTSKTMQGHICVSPFYRRRGEKFFAQRILATPTNSVILKSRTDFVKKIQGLFVFRKDMKLPRNGRERTSEKGAWSQPAVTMRRELRYRAGSFCRGEKFFAPTSDITLPCAP